MLPAHLSERGCKMEDGLTEILALSGSGVTTLLIAVTAFFLKNEISVTKKMADQMNSLTTRVVVIEQRDGQLLQLQDDIAKIREDMVWMREKLDSLTVEKRGG